MPLEERRDDERIYHKYTLEQLNKLCPVVDWVRYFKYAFAPVNHTITAEETLIVYSPDYLAAMSKLIERYSSTSQGKV